MKIKLWAIALLLYGLTAVSFVCLLPLIAFDSPIQHTLLAIWRTEYDIFRSVVQLSRHAFPHFYSLNVALVFGCVLIGLGSLLMPYLRRFYGIYMRSQTQRMNRIFTFIMITGFLILGLVLEECSFRIAHVYSPYFSPYTLIPQGWIYSHVPYSKNKNTTQDFAYWVANNSLGFVDADWPEQKKTGTTRIACLGDSFTEGVGAPADSSYPRLLSRTIPSFDVMNVGVGGSDPVFEFEVLKKVLAPYHPDVVIVAINMTDIYDVEVRGGVERFKKDGTTAYRPAPFWEAAYHHSFVARVALRHLYSFHSYPSLPVCDSALESQKAFKVLEETIDSIQDWCDSRHIRSVFVFHPVRPEFERGVMNCAPVMYYARHRHYEVIDMLQEFQRFGMTPENCQKYYWPHDGHHNGSGYYLFAQAIKNYLIAPAVHDSSRSDILPPAIY